MELNYFMVLWNADRLLVAGCQLCCYLQFTTDNKIFIKSIQLFDIYILEPKSWLIDWLRRRVVQFRIVMSASYDTQKKLSHFDLKSWVTCRTKIQSGKVGNWRIFESNWLNIKSQIDSTLRVKLTQHWEYNWLNIESQVGSTLRVKLTQHWELNWFNIESPIDSNILQLLTLPNWIIIPPVTQLLRSKWLNFFSRCTERKIESFWPKKLGQILVPPVTQLLWSKWLNYFSRCTERKIESFWPKKNGSNFGSDSDSTFRQNDSIFFSWCTERKKYSHFDLKNWVTWVEMRQKHLNWKKKHLLYWSPNG